MAATSGAIKVAEDSIKKRNVTMFAVTHEVGFLDFDMAAEREFAKYQAQQWNSEPMFAAERDAAQ